MEFIQNTSYDGELRTKSKLRSMILQWFNGYELKDTTLRAVRANNKTSLERVYVLVKR
jgi:hypothetical protein